MLFNGNDTFIFIFSSIFHVIQWEFCIFFHFPVNFPCYSMRNLHFLLFLEVFHVIQWGVCILSIFHVIQWEFENWEASGGGRTDGQTYRRTDGCKEIHPCVLQDIGPLGPLLKQQAKSHSSPKAVSGQRYPCPAKVVCALGWGGAGQRPQREQSPVKHRGNLSVRTYVHMSVCPSPHPILRALSPLGPILTHILPNSPNPSNMAQI